MLKRWIALYVCMLMACCSIPSICSAGAEESWDVTQRLSRYANGIRNPLKGWRADNDMDSRYGSLARYYVKWNDIENNAADGVDKLLDYTYRMWSEAHLLNTKIIPRVYLHLPDVDTYWPDDLETGDYTSPAFQDRLRGMIEKMAAAWDNDPRIAYIEMGLIGYWGEQHSPSPTPEVEKLLTETFRKYFQNTLIMVRYPTSQMFAEGGFGLYWDEWGSEAQWNVLDRIDLVVSDAYKDRWKTAVFGGENTNNFYSTGGDGGYFYTYGCDKPFDAETAFTTYASEMIKYARLVHANHMHTRLLEVKSIPAQMNVNVFQDTLGYAFELKQARFNHVNSQERNLQFSFDVINTGASPFYYDWPVRVSLLDSNTLKPVWSSLIPGSSVKDWMPGEEWQADEKKYAIPAKTYTVDSSMTVPASVKDGSYLLALSIPDPAGLTNAAVFLNTGYISGGYTVLGTIGVGTEPAQNTSIFGKLIPARDRTLLYAQNYSHHKKCTVPELTDGLSTTSWVSDGSAAVIDLGSLYRLNSITVQFAREQAPFKVYIAEKEGTWQEVSGETFQNRTNETHVLLDGRARYIRIVPQSGATLTQVMVYGI